MEKLSNSVCSLAQVNQRMSNLFIHPQDRSLKRRKTFISRLYQMCVRIVARNIDYYNRQTDLSILPWTIKTDLMYLNMKLFSGFSNEQSFMRLLTSNMKRLRFQSSVVTDSMLQCIEKKCKNLQQLMITSGTFQFTHVGIHKCIDALENLRTLQIAATDEVNDTIVEVIGRRCQHLRCLWLNDCPNVTDACSDSLKSMELVELNLANTSITNKLLIELGDSVLMETLRDICLKNCKITNEGLKHLNWMQLENINIIGASIVDLSFIPSAAVYKTLNWSI